MCERESEGGVLLSHRRAQGQGLIFPESTER